MDEITKIETIDQYDQLFGLETLHPLVNVIDFSKATKTVEYYHMNIGFYSLFLKDINCGDAGSSRRGGASSGGPGGGRTQCDLGQWTFKARVRGYRKRFEKAWGRHRGR